jgi:hypothetical protein
MFTSPAWLAFLNVFFLVFHTLWMAFNMTGWAWKKTRRLHLLTMGLTALSWFVVGPLWYGTLGYCLCTDWHWEVLTGLDLSPLATDLLTGGVFGFSVIMMIAMNLRDWRENRVKPSSGRA